MAVLSADYVGVSIFWLKKSGLYEKKDQRWVKIDKIRHFLTKRGFFICSSMNLKEMPISSLSGDKTALPTQFSPF